MAFIPLGLFERLNEICGEGLPVKFDISPEGGYCCWLINKTGAPSVKGMVVEPSSSDNLAFAQVGADGYDPIGVVYTDGVADGSGCWVVTGGICQVLLEDGSAGTRENWVKVSETDAGRADASIAAPSGGAINELDEHFREIGHCLESVGADVDVLCYIMLHFN